MNSQIPSASSQNVSADSGLGSGVQITSHNAETANVTPVTSNEAQIYFEAFHQAPVGTVLVTRQNRIAHLNKAFADFLGHSESELLQMGMDDLVHPDDRHLDDESVRELLEGHVTSYQTDKRFHHESGEWMWGSLNVSLANDDKGRPLYSICQIQNITLRKEAEAQLKAENQRLQQINETLAFDKERLEAVAHIDDLTLLKNRRAFNERLHEEVARSKRTQVGFSLFLLDIDYFKEYNETFGSGAGDEVLRELAAILKKTLRTADTVARYGGEEFALILPSTGALGGYRAADRCREAIANHPWPRREITVSCGACTWVDEEDAALLELADVALATAKRTGRNRVCHSQFPVETPEPI